MSKNINLSKGSLLTINIALCIMLMVLGIQTAYLQFGGENFYFLAFGVIVSLVSVAYWLKYWARQSKIGHKLLVFFTYVFFILATLVSIGLGILFGLLNCWEETYCGPLDDTGFWPIFWIFILPPVLIALLITIQVYYFKRTKK